MDSYPFFTNHIVLILDSQRVKGKSQGILLMRRISVVNIHTARARDAALRDYHAFIERSGKEDLIAWSNDLQARGLAANTIRQRIFLIRAWLGINSPVDLPARRTVRKRKWLDVEQTRALLSAIPEKPSGQRDFALIAALLVTGLRIGQVRGWKWDDVCEIGRNGLTNKRDLPMVVFKALQVAIDRTPHSNNMMLLGCLLRKEHVFSASQCWLRMNNNFSLITTDERVSQPLSPQEINRRIGRYARLAGMESDGVTAECLRRTNKKLGQGIVTALVQDAFESRNARPVRWKRMDRDVRLHGIGRRSR